MLRAFGNLNPPGHPGYLSGSYYSTPCSNAVNTAAVAVNTLYLEPWLIYEPVTIDRLGVNVSVGAVGNVKVGIYAINRDGSMAKVAENNADMSTAAAADLEGSFAANPALAPGWYAFGSCYSATPTMRNTPGGVMLPTAFVGGAAAGVVTFSGGGSSTGWTTALAYTAGPTNFFPASIATGSLTRGAFTPTPRVFMRKA